VTLNRPGVFFSEQTWCLLIKPTAWQDALAKKKQNQKTKTTKTKTLKKAQAKKQTLDLPTSCTTQPQLLLS